MNNRKTFTYMKKTLDEIVEEMLKEHTGGVTFFDHLDEAIRDNSSIIDSLLDLVGDVTDKNIAVSGKFGQFFKKYAKISELKFESLVIFPGGLREGKTVEGLWEITDVHNKEYIFIDDSFYSGKTRDVINDALKLVNSKIVTTYVVYDGSHEHQNSVHSLYRYYK